MNVRNYPNSSNAWDSLGDYYVKVGDTPHAIESYMKAVAIAEVPYTRKKLDKLQKEK